MNESHWLLILHFVFANIHQVMMDVCSTEFSAHTIRLQFAFVGTYMVLNVPKK